jgi:hypothetical protein
VTSLLESQTTFFISAQIPVKNLVNLFPAGLAVTARVVIDITPLPQLPIGLFDLFKSHMLATAWTVFF